MNELETSIVDINDDALDALFEETPNTTVNANALVGGKKPEAADPIQDVEEEEEEEEVPVKKTTAKKTKDAPAKKEAPIEDPSSIQDVDLEELDKEESEEEGDEAEKKDDAKKKEAKSKEEKKEDKSEDKSEVLSVLKSTVDYLVESGQWADFEGRAEMDIDEESYAKLVAEQDKLRVQSMFSELVDSTGPFGKAIIDYVKSGGNPDEIIDLFKEQKSIESINIDTVDGQKDIVKQYYTDVMGWKPEKAEKFVSQLVLSNELENEASEVKDNYTAFYKKEADRLSNEQKEFVDKQKEAAQAFENNIKTAVKERKDLSTTERKTVEDYLLNYDQKLPNGQLVNKFYVNFAKMQANPQDYIDLVMFVMDKQRFMQKVATKEKSEATAKAFSFIKGNGAVSKTRGTTYDSLNKKEKISGFDWGIPSKR